MDPKKLTRYTFTTSADNKKPNIKMSRKREDEDRCFEHLLAFITKAAEQSKNRKPPIYFDGTYKED